MRVAPQYLVPLALTLAGCVSSRVDPVPQKALAQVPEAEAEQKTKDLIVERLATRALQKGRLNFLLLSVGGQHGAYGMGYLSGWESNEFSQFPDFDLVTGSSTGALQAPFAVSGSREALEVGPKAYREIAVDSALSFDYAFWLRKRGGIFDTTDFEAKLRESFTPELKRALKRSFAQGNP